jgi:hypothetical protein
LPRRPSVVSGSELIHSVAPASEGKVPSMPSARAGAGSRAAAVGIRLASSTGTSISALGGCGLRGPILSTSACSSAEVVPTERRASRPVSRPSAIAPTPTSTAAPAARRIHSPVWSDPFKAANTRPPKSSAAASEVHAPAA